MNLNRLPAPDSLTHQHLFACLNTLISVDASSVRILDAGCGDGRLISFIHRALKAVRPGILLEVSGFDVVDHGVQAAGFMEKAIETLATRVPDVNWAERIKLLYVGNSWDFPDKYFDIVLSNQVLEHVHDKPFFFRESYRVLRDGGYAIHLSPLVHYIYEGHLYLPWVHRIRSHELLCRYISLLSFFGLGKFRDHNRRTGISRDEFSIRHADYVHFWTNYSSESEMLDIARTNKFRASFRFNIEFYLLKLRQILHLPYKANYKLARSAFFDSIAIKFLRYLSGTTLVCEKRNTYEQQRRQ